MTVKKLRKEKEEKGYDSQKYYPFFKSQDIAKLSQKSHLINASSFYISELYHMICKAGIFRDDGRCWVANQQRNGHTVVLNHMWYSKFQGQSIEQDWKGLGNLTLKWINISPKIIMMFSHLTKKVTAIRHQYLGERGINWEFFFKIF